VPACADRARASRGTVQLCPLRRGCVPPHIIRDVSFDLGQTAPDGKQLDHNHRAPSQPTMRRRKDDRRSSRTSDRGANALRLAECQADRAQPLRKPAPGPHAFWNDSTAERRGIFARRGIPAVHPDRIDCARELRDPGLRSKRKRTPVWPSTTPFGKLTRCRFWPFAAGVRAASFRARPCGSARTRTCRCVWSSSSRTFTKYW